MYLLYLDDSGSAENMDEKYFVLAGMALFERHVYHLSKALDSVAEGTGLEEPETLEFHAVDIFNRKKRWKPLNGLPKRRAVISDALKTANELRGQWYVFGAVIEKAAVLTRNPPADPVEYAFKQVLTRFDNFLDRSQGTTGKQRGVVIIDESPKAVVHRGARMSTERKLRDLATEYRRRGHDWGALKWIVDTPFFVDSKATRAGQYADLIAYAMRRKFEMDDCEFFDLIKHRFHQSGGVVHSFVHERYADSVCDCPYCASRRRESP